MSPPPPLCECIYFYFVHNEWGWFPSLSAADDDDGRECETLKLKEKNLYGSNTENKNALKTSYTYTLQIGCLLSTNQPSNTPRRRRFFISLYVVDAPKQALLVVVYHHQSQAVFLVCWLASVYASSARFKTRKTPCTTYYMNRLL